MSTNPMYVIAPSLDGDDSVQEVSIMLRDEVSITVRDRFGSVSEYRVDSYDADEQTYREKTDRPNPSLLAEATSPRLARAMRREPSASSAPAKPMSRPRKVLHVLRAAFDELTP